MKRIFKILTLTTLLILMVTPAFALATFTDVPLGFPAGWANNIGQFNAVWGADANNVYAVGYGNNANQNAPLIMYSDGSTWFDDSPTLPGGYTSGQLRNIWGSGTSDIYAVGYGYDSNGQAPLLYHNDGTAWSVQTLPLPGSWTYVQYNAVWGTSASNVYIGGYAYDDPDQILLLFHWDGTNWTDVSPALPGFVYTGQIESIWGSSANDIFVAGWGQEGVHYTSQPVVVHYDGNSWTDISPGLPQDWTIGTLYEVWGSSATNVYVVGEGFDSVAGKYLPMILYYDGTDWFTDNPALTNGLEGGYLQSIWGSGASDIYAVGRGQFAANPGNPQPLLFHNDGSGWTQASPALPAGVDWGYLNTVWGSDASNIYTAGQGNTQAGEGYDQSLLLYQGLGDSAPTVSTDSIETLNSRKVNATLSSLGSPASVSAHGVVYNTTGTPTISDSKVDKGSGITGAYTIGLNEMSLTPGIKYYVRAFATNATGTSYGAELVVYGTPGDFTHIAPLNNATDVSTSPTLSWNASTGATDYEYCVQPLLANCTSNFFGPNWHSTGGATSVNLSGLSSSTNYVWAVRAVVGTPASYKWVTGAPFNFTTAIASNPGVGVYDDADLNWTYTGAWTAITGTAGSTNGTLHRSQTIGDQASFSFNGNQFKLKYTQNTNRGNVGVYVDGNLVTTLNENGAVQWQKVYTSPILASGDHTVEFRNAGGSTFVDVDQIEILVTAAPGAGVYDDSFSGWVYTGSWTAFSGTTGPKDGTLHRSQTVDDKATFMFSGTQFVLKYTQNTNRGNVGVYLDGNLVTTLNENGALQWQATYTSPVFAAGTHTVEFRNAGGSTYADIDSLQILNSTPAGVGLYDDADSKWTYTGTWTAMTGVAGSTTGTLHRNQTVGDSATFMFSGTQFKLKYTQNTNRGNVGVYVDGNLVTTLNENGALQWQKVYTSPIFASGNHTVELRNAGGNTFVDVDEIEVLATAAPGTGVYDDSFSGWIYTGSWTTITGAAGSTDGTLHRSQTLGDKATIVFSGTQFILKYTQNTNRGNVGVYVDGNLVTTLSENGVLQWQTTYTSPVFSAGTHTVEFRNAGGNTYIDIDSIQIP